MCDISSNPIIISYQRHDIFYEWLKFELCDREKVACAMLYFHELFDLEVYTCL